MNLELLRFSGGKDDTLGLFNINGSFACFTLEDEKRTIKVFGETRIPEGRYKIAFRTVGRLHAKYSQKFPAFHSGMLELQDVPGFKYILIHIGNDDDDTAGCILVGNTLRQNVTGKGFLGESTKAYERIYKKIAAALIKGEEVWIDIKTLKDNG